MSKLTRRNFLGAAAVMAGGLTGLQKVVGAEFHAQIEARAIRDPLIRRWMARTRIPYGHLARTPRAWSKTSSIHSPLRTSVLMRVDGHAR